MTRKTRLLLKGVAGALFVVGIVWLEREFHLSRWLDPEQVEGRLRSAGPLAPLVFILVMSATVLSPVPTFPLDLLAGRVFGPRITVSPVFALAGGGAVVALYFLLPRWIERHDLLGMRRLFSHGDEPPSTASME